MGWHGRFDAALLRADRQTSPQIVPTGFVAGIQAPPDNATAQSAIAMIRGTAMDTSKFSDFFVDVYLAISHHHLALSDWVWFLATALLVLAGTAIYSFRHARSTGTGDNVGRFRLHAGLRRQTLPEPNQRAHAAAAEYAPPAASAHRQVSHLDNSNAADGGSTTSSAATHQSHQVVVAASRTVVDIPAFAEPESISATGRFRVPHPSDAAAYKELDTLNRLKKAMPLPFPPSRGGVEPVLMLEHAWGPAGPSVIERIKKAGQIVFHAAGDTGNTRSTEPQEQLAEKLISDFDEETPHENPAFFFHLGDVVYSFGEAKYYYDQFYEPYRNYPAPILAIAGNHDGMIEPHSQSASLEAFLRNFCTDKFCKSPEAGNLERTTMIQPGVYFTFEAPYLRVLGIYSNALEDPGVISSQGGNVKTLSNKQLDFLTAALARAKKEGFTGAILIAVHHPPFTASMAHSGSPMMLKDLDSVSTATGVWPHAVLSAHAHNYQRFTRQRGDMQIPYIVAGNGGHGLTRLHRGNGPSLRTPLVLPARAKEGDKVTLENYDDQDYGYLRVLVNASQLRIEYHPASDGPDAKTPDDHVTIDLKSRRIVHYDA
jgi:hypothetical protein